MTLRSAGDLLRTLETGTYTVSGLYNMAERAGIADQPGGRDLIQDGNRHAEQYQRRVRSALQHLRAKGMAERVRPGEWLIQGSRRQPRRCLLVVLNGEPGQLELALGEAARILAETDEPIDLVVADPPWSLKRDTTVAWERDRMDRAYTSDRSKVMGGYRDVPAHQYAEFTEEWMLAAAEAIRPGGYLAVITGAQQAARVQTIGEDRAGLTYVNSIAVKRTMGMYSTRRFVHQHNTVTLLTKGQLDSNRRFFERPAEMPRGRKGEIYAVDVWLDVPDYRPPHGALRYDNALNPLLVSRIVRSCTRPAELVADPFVGSGTTALVALREGRRFYGGDLNAEALRFTMGRILHEEQARQEVAA